MLKAIVENLDGIDEKYHDLYEERDGKFQLKPIEGFKTEADVQRVQISLQKERNDHKATKAKFAVFDGMDLTEVTSKLDRFDELEEIAKGKVDDKQIEEIVERRLRSKVAPIERELNQTKTQLQEANGQIEAFKGKDRSRTINDQIREAALKAKILPEALDDALLLAERIFELDEDGNVVTKEGKSFTEGVGPAVWITEVQSKRPHWWPASAGSNAGGSRGTGSGANPWSNKAWNVTQQAQLYKENPTKAAQMAKAAGTSIGGKRPSAK